MTATDPRPCATCGDHLNIHMFGKCIGNRGLCTCTAYVPPAPTENTNLLVDPFAADLGMSASDAVVANGWAEDEATPTPDPTVFGAYDGSSWPASIGPTTGDTEEGVDPAALDTDHLAYRAALDAYDETVLRERIAAEILAERDRLWIDPDLVLLDGRQVLDRDAYAAQWTAAARIARGTP